MLWWKKTPETVEKEGEKINLKQKAQNIVKSISKYNFLNDQEILKKIEKAHRKTD